MIEKIKFIFIESFKTFKRYSLYSFISSLTIMICLLLISFIIYLSNVTSNISENFKSNESILQIFINNSISEEESKKICDEITNDSNFIKKNSFKNREELFKQINSSINLENDLKKWIKDDISFMPCLCSAVIDIKESIEVDKIIESFKSNYSSSLDKIIYPDSYLNKFQKISSSLFVFIFILGLIIFIVSIFNVSNVVKLNLESRKDVIETLKLHGATKIFIKLPFIIEGLIQGILGAFLSILILYLIFNFYSFDTHNHFLIQSFITTLPFKTYLFFNIIFGILLGFISSNLGVSNYLD